MQKIDSCHIRMLQRRTSQLLGWGKELDEGKISLEIAFRKYDRKSKLIQESFERIFDSESFQPLVPSREMDSLLISFCLAADRFYLHRYSPEKRHRLFDSALESAKRSENPFGISRMYSLLGSALTGQHLYQRARECYEASLNLSGNESEPQHLIKVHANLGNLYGWLNEIEKAFQHQFAALAIAKKECPSKRSKLLCCIGWSYRRTQNWEKAIDYFLKSANEAMDVIDEGYALGSLGSTYRQIGETEKAEIYLRKRISLARRIDDVEGERNSLGCLGNVYSDVGRFTEAWKCHNDALTLSRKRHDKGGEATDINNLGDVLQRQGDNANAIAQYRRAAELFHAVGDYQKQAISLNHIAKSQAETDEFELAISAAKQAILALENSGNSQNQIDEIKELIQNWNEQLSIQEIEQ